MTPTLANVGLSVCFSGMLIRLEWLVLLVTGTRGDRALMAFMPTPPGDLCGASLAQSVKCVQHSMEVIH